MAQYYRNYFNFNNAISSGNTVITSQREVNYGNWRGSEYIVIDPRTGSGAYMISGGLDGSFTYIIGVLTGFGLMVLLSMIGKISLIAFPYGALISLILFVVMIIMIYIIQLEYLSIQDEEKQKCYLGGILTGMSFKAVFSTPMYLTRIIALFSGVTNSFANTNNFSTCREL